MLSREEKVIELPNRETLSIWVFNLFSTKSHSSLSPSYMCNKKVEDNFYFFPKWLQGNPF